jgi:hypothetical protein
VDPSEIIKLLRSTPFQPFEMRLHDGRTFPVRHPELVLVTRRSIILAWHNNGSHGLADDWTVISPVAIASLHPVIQR